MGKKERQTINTTILVVLMVALFIISQIPVSERQLGPKSP